jgi:putative transposase
VSRMRTITDAQTNAAARRGFSRQRRRRAAEVIARRSVVRTTRWLMTRGYPEKAAASRIGLVPRTARTWRARWYADRLAPRARGRPVERPDRDIRNVILSLFSLLGPDISEEQLCAEMPDVSRAEIRELKRRYRAVWRRGNVTYVSALRWRWPGSVWAMDFTEPPLPVDGIFKRILVARDLPSSSQLEALPTPGEDADVACDLLRALIRRHGAPLVMKTDNGSAFRSKDFADLLKEHGILHLKSPPYTPRYNGAVETGIGTLKTHAQYASARHDRPGEWTCDDVEEARLLGNAYSRPHGGTGATPDEAWKQKTKNGSERRNRFLAMYDEEVEKEKERRGVLPLIELTPQEKDAIDRHAISKALRQFGCLDIRRRRITPPVTRRKAACIT